eukprot:11573422-Alexandrium_andersonii.AAC.1
MVSCLRDPADGALTFAPLRLDAALRHARQPVFEAPAGVEGDSALSLGARIARPAAGCARVRCWPIGP